MIGMRARRARFVKLRAGGVKLNGVDEIPKCRRNIPVIQRFLERKVQTADKGRTFPDQNIPSTGPVSHGPPPDPPGSQRIECFEGTRQRE